MTATLLYRIAAVVLLLFAAGHTAGFLTFRPSTAEGMAAYNAMHSVRIEVGGAERTYEGLYRGFGLTVTAYMLLSAFLAWHLGAVAAKEPRSIVVLAWVFAAAQAACLGLSVIYFFLVPAVFSAAVVICLVWAAWLLRNASV